MSKAAFFERDGALFPMDDDGREMLAAVKDKRVVVHVHAPRNVLHHRLLFALLRDICQAGAWDGDEESLLAWLKIATGLVDMIVGPDGRPYYVPRSIAFESMDQASFSRWFERACFVITARLLKSDRWEDLRDRTIASLEKSLPERRAA